LRAGARQEGVEGQEPAPASAHARVDQLGRQGKRGAFRAVQGRALFSGRTRAWGLKQTSEVQAAATLCSLPSHPLQKKGAPVHVSSQPPLHHTSTVCGQPRHPVRRARPPTPLLRVLVAAGRAQRTCTCSLFQRAWVSGAVGKAGP